MARWIDCAIDSLARSNNRLAPSTKKHRNLTLESLEDRVTPTAIPVLISPTAAVRVDQSSYLIQGQLQATAPVNGTMVSAYRDTNNDQVFSQGDTLVASVLVPQGSTNFTLSPNLLQDASNRFFLVANDGGTNSSPLTVPAITEDSTAPRVLSINRIGDQTTSSSSVQFQVTFSEPVKGVDATDFAVVASGSVSANPKVAVTGLGNTYQVTVNNLSGSGSLGLNLIDDDTIRDLLTSTAQEHPLAGTNSPGGNFTGQTFTVTGATSSTFSTSFDNIPGDTLGNGWTTQAGSFSTATNAAVGQAALNLASLNNFTLTNVSARADVIASAAGRAAGLTVRYSGPGDRNMYWGTLFNRGGVLQAEIWRNVNGAGTLLGYARLMGVNPAVAHRLRFDAVGSSLKLSVDDTLRVEVTDSALASGRVGLRSLAGASFDNLSLGTTTPPALSNFTSSFEAGAGNTLGSAWMTQTGSYATATGAAVGQAALNLATLSGFSLANVSVQADVLATAAGRAAGLVVRSIGNNGQNLYWGTLFNRGGVLQAEVWRVLNGAGTLLASARLPDMDASVAHLLRFDAVGTSLRLSVDDTLRVETNDGSLQSGQSGLRSTAGASLDNLELTTTIPPSAGSFSAPIEPSTGNSLGTSWSNQVGSYSTTTGTAIGQSAINLASLNNFSLSDASVRADVLATAAGRAAGLIVRYGGPGDRNYYWGTLFNRGGVLQAEIWRNVNGAGTLLKHTRLTGLDAAAIHRLRFEAVGNSLKLFVDETLRVETTDGALTSGRVGVRSTAGAVLDNFVLGVSVRPGLATFTSPPASSGQSSLATIVLPSIDLNLLGLEVRTSEIIIKLSAEAGEGKLLGNLLTLASNLINLQRAGDALNQVLSTTVGLLNTADLGINLSGSNSFDNRVESSLDVLQLHVAPVHLDLLGALVDTSPIDVNIIAHSGQGLILGNIVTDLANLFNDLPGQQLNIDVLNQKLSDLLGLVNDATPGITPASVPTVQPAEGQILHLTVPALDLNLLGLKLVTSPITVNAAAQEGSGKLLGNVLTSLLGTLDATPEKIAQLNNTLNGVLAKVVGVLNAADLTVVPALVSALPPALQTLLQPTLTAPAGSEAPILDLVIASGNNTQPPVNVDLLGLVVTTSNIDAHLSAVTGDGQILGNLLYNIANLANPGGPGSLLTLLNALGAGDLGSTAGSEGGTSGGSTTPAPEQLLQIKLDPLNLDLLGLHVKSNEIIVTISAQGGDAKLLGNLLGGLSTLLNLDGVETALNNVLSTTVGLANSIDLSLPAGSVAGNAFTTGDGTITPVLQVDVAPVHLDLLGLVVTTSPIHLTIEAESGNGLVLGNVVTELAHLFDNPPPELTVDKVNNRLAQLLQDLNQEIPGITPAATPPVTLEPGQFLELTLSPIDLNLLGLVLKTSQITVNAFAQEGDGNLLGNLLSSLLNTIDATPGNLTVLNQNLNALLAKVIGVLNAAQLTLPQSAIDALPSVLQTLAAPLLIAPTPGATTQILDLIVASPDQTQPPVQADLLGLVVTTSDIQAQLLAQTGNGQVLGNLLYNVANLLNPGNTTTLLFLLAQLGRL